MPPRDRPVSLNRNLVTLASASATPVTLVVRWRESSTPSGRPPDARCDPLRKQGTRLGADRPMPCLPTMRRRQVADAGRRECSEHLVLRVAVRLAEQPRHAPERRQCVRYARSTAEYAVQREASDLGELIADCGRLHCGVSSPRPCARNIQIRARWSADGALFIAARANLVSAELCT